MGGEGRILVITSNAFFRGFVGLTLEDEGYQVRSAPHGDAALALIEQWPPDLILLDVHTQDTDGWDFARAYQQRSDAHARILALTLRAFVGAEVLGAADILGTPFDRDLLIEMVNGHLGEPRSLMPPTPSAPPAATALPCS